MNAYISKFIVLSVILSNLTIIESSITFSFSFSIVFIFSSTVFTLFNGVSSVKPKLILYLLFSILLQFIKDSFAIIEFGIFTIEFSNVRNLVLL